MVRFLSFNHPATKPAQLSVFLSRVIPTAYPRHYPDGVHYIFAQDCHDGLPTAR
jgi:hypothetical protein